MKRLQGVKIPGVETFVRPVKEHRFVVVFRVKGLDGAVADQFLRSVAKFLENWNEELL